MLHNHLRNLNNLSRTERCPGMFAYERQTVSEHSFKVMQYAQFFANIEQMNGAEIDFKVLYEKVLNHDVPEILTGDIPTPVKYKTDKMREVVAEVEELLVEEYIHEVIPSEFKDLTTTWFGEGKDNSVEGNILKLADKLDQLYEAFEELQKGNTNYAYIRMYKNALVYVISLRSVLPVSFKYFMNQILAGIVKEHVYICNLREITEEILDCHDLKL